MIYEEFLEALRGHDTIIFRLSGVGETECATKDLTEIESAVQKQMPKPLRCDEFGWNVCPNDCTISGLISNKFDYCPYCGQKIDRR